MSFTKFALTLAAASSLATAAAAEPPGRRVAAASSSTGGSTSKGAAQVPAPRALWLFAAGLAALGWRFGRRRS